jgi:uncharacterized UBP type Zn finger protein
VIEAPICTHTAGLGTATPRTRGCEECRATGGQWVHLRLCLGCGHVGCCDDSPNRHATGHFVETGHPIFQSFEPGERWRWCFIDRVYLSEED